MAPDSTRIRPECALFVQQVSARDAINAGSPLYPNAINHVIASAGLPPKIDPEWDLPTLDKLFPPPVDATLRSRMRSFRDAGVEARPIVLTLVARLEREMAESPGSDFRDFA